MTKTAVQQKHVTVGIVGGGIAGLTLANYLEQAGIPYLLWEKGAEIVPAVGASVGMMPNGLRVLDQLGIIDELEKYRIEHDRWEHRDGDDGTLYTATTAMRSHANELVFRESWFVEVNRPGGTNGKAIELAIVDLFSSERS